MLQKINDRINKRVNELIPRWETKKNLADSDPSPPQFEDISQEHDG